jgi:hypothetical protein
MQGKGREGAGGVEIGAVSHFTPADPGGLPCRNDRLRCGHYSEVHSVLIVKDGRLIFEGSFPGHAFGYSSPDFLADYVEFGRSTRHNTHSATKSVISAPGGVWIHN